MASPNFSNIQTISLLNYFQLNTMSKINCDIGITPHPRIETVTPGLYIISIGLSFVPSYIKKISSFKFIFYIKLNF